MLKILHHTLRCLIFLLAGNASAAETHTYYVFTDIPALSFYVLPVNPTLFIQPQNLQWNVASSEFKPFTTHFNVRNQTGGLQAKLGSTATLQRGFDNPGEIELQVKLNNTVLTTTPQLILDQATAQNEARVALNIHAIKPTLGYSAGTYRGSVTLIFEATAP